MSAWTSVVAALDAAGIPCVLVGGLAMGARGVPRATRDADLLAPEAALAPEVWDAARAAGCSVDLRRGGPDDPLVGVVRVRRGSGAPADVVVVGRWAEPMLERGAGPVRIRGAAVRVADAADLALLKLYAGGPRDLSDVRMLLAVDPGVAARIESRLADAHPACGEAWAAFRGPA